MEELQYYTISDDYCSVCLNSSAVVRLLPNTAKLFFSTIEASVMTPWLCNRCSDILGAYQDSSQSSVPEVQESYEKLKIRARRAQSLLSDILLNSQVVQSKLDYYIAELNEIKCIDTTETLEEAQVEHYIVELNEIKDEDDTSSDIITEPKQTKVCPTADCVVFDENDHMYARLSTVLKGKVVKIKITEQDYVEWVEEQLETESYRTSKFQCEHCALGFSRERPFSHHMKLHNSNTGAHRCPLCERYFRAKRTLREHMMGHLSHYSCAECGLHTNARSVVADHYLSEHTQIQFSCKHCDVAARTPSALKQHLNTVHQYECHDCGKKCFNKTELQAHIVQRHLKTRSVKCTMCEKMFVTKIHRRLHVRKFHLNIRPIKNKICDVCNKTFNATRDLSRHKLVHTGERPYQCDQCGLKFQQKCILGTHIQIKHMGSSYKEIVINRRKRYQALNK